MLGNTYVEGEFYLINKNGKRIHKKICYGYSKYTNLNTIKSKKESYKNAILKALFIYLGNLNKTPYDKDIESGYIIIKSHINYIKKGEIKKTKIKLTRKQKNIVKKDIMTKKERKKVEIDKDIYQKSEDYKKMFKQEKKKEEKRELKRDKEIETLKREIKRLKKRNEKLKRS